MISGSDPPLLLCFYLCTPRPHSPSPPPPPPLSMAAPALSAVKLHLHGFHPNFFTIRGKLSFLRSFHGYLAPLFLLSLLELYLLHLLFSGHGCYANSCPPLMRTRCSPLRTFSIRCSSRSLTGHSEGVALRLDSLENSGGGAMMLDDSPDPDESHALEKIRGKKFKNRFLKLVRLGSVINDAAESFFKSEIRRRLFVTAVLILISRIGYFIPLPGFDRRMMPEDYLSFASGSMGMFLPKP